MIQRPKLKIHGCWCFGHVLRLAILEEGSFHGSSMVRELLSLTLEDVVQECARKGKPCPDTVIIVGDNTVKELKNGTNLLYAASLVNHGHLRHLGDCMENDWLKANPHQICFGLVKCLAHAFCCQKVRSFDDDEGVTHSWCDRSFSKELVYVYFFFDSESVCSGFWHGASPRSTMGLIK